MEGGGGGGVKCEKVESMFNQELTLIGPRPDLILFDPYTATKNSFTLLEITIGQDKIYGWSAHWRPIIFLSVNWRPIIFLSVNWRLIIFLSIIQRLTFFHSALS